MELPPKAETADFIGRFREVISDPLNLLIERVPMAGVVEGDEVCLHNGIRVPVAGSGAYYGGFSDLLVLNRGVHEPLEEYVFQEVLRNMPEAPRMIELGAYWAHYSMWLKKERPGATVIMVEPDPDNLAAGEANFRRNGFDGEFIEAAVARDHWRLDPFMQSRGIDRLNILHVDIQGFEVDLIEGGRDSLKRQAVDYLFVSTHSQDIHHHVVGELSRLGYRVEVKSDFDNQSTSYDGLVFASSPRAAPVFRNFPHIGRKSIVASRADDLVRAVLDCRNSRVKT
ncbi:MAG TPA: FkbM family methyltransferase [Burkholderiales bacterium]|nr:FkbM family methyltransferase [Burkholderiales bacterium]